jgi:hypothetical protein
MLPSSGCSMRTLIKYKQIEVCLYFMASGRTMALASDKKEYQKYFVGVKAAGA